MTRATDNAIREDANSGREAWMRFLSIRFPNHYRVEPTWRDFYNTLVRVIDDTRDKAHRENGGKAPARCLDEGHEFLCRFPAGSCSPPWSQCNEPDDADA